MLIPLFGLTLFAYIERERIFGVDTPVRVAAAVVMVILGWALARDLGRFTAPALFRRMDPATAGTAGFLIRFAFLIVAAIASLRVAGLDPATLALGGAITAVVIGLAAQQTLGNLIAGLVLISVRPFKVGDRVRLQAGGLAGQVEGVVASLGLLYTTFAQGQDSIMVPNNVVLSAAVVPLREPAAVDLRARLRPDVRPERRPGDARGHDLDAGPRRADDRARGDRRRRGRRPHPGDPAVGRRRPAARRRGARRGRRRDGPQRRRRAPRDLAPRRRRRHDRATAASGAARRSARAAAGRAGDAGPARARRSALVGLAAADRVGRSSSRPSRRWTAPTGPGARLARSAPARSGSGATSSSARLCSIALTTARATSSGRLVPTNGGSLRAGVGEHARRRG